MGTSNFDLPLISGTASVKVPRDMNALANAIDAALLAERNLANRFLAQTDYVNLLSGHVEYDKMYVKRENSLNWITVMLKRKEEHLSWTFRNNTYDDFMILGDCFTGVASTGLTAYENKNYETLTGTWVTTAPNAHYATSIGATMTTTVTGEAIEFHFYGDNRGGVWEFVIDGDTTNKVTISTWKATATATNSVTLKTGLAFGPHTVVGTFKGDDPANAPSSGAGTARGWVYVNGSNSFLTYRTFKTQITNSREKDLLVGFSNKEYAIKIRKKGIGTHQFVPMHSNIGTAFNAEPMRILVDGASWSPSTAVIGEFIECSSFRLVQHVYGRNPDSGAENLIDMATTVSINKKGCAEISGKMKVLQDIDVLDGYFIMVPLAKPMIDRAVTSINNTYACTKTDGTKTYLDTEGDKAISYAFVSGTEKDYVTAVRFCDSKNTLRTGGSGKYAYAMNTWLEHRDATLTKLYASAFSNTILTTGQSFRFSGSIMPAKIPGVNDFL